MAVSRCKLLLQLNNDCIFKRNKNLHIFMSTYLIIFLSLFSKFFPHYYITLCIRNLWLIEFFTFFSNCTFADSTKYSLQDARIDCFPSFKTRNDRSWNNTIHDYNIAVQLCIPKQIRPHGSTVTNTQTSQQLDTFLLFFYHTWLYVL